MKRRNPRFAQTVIREGNSVVAYGVFDAAKDRYVMGKDGRPMAFESGGKAAAFADKANARLSVKDDKPFAGSGWGEERTWLLEAKVSKSKRVSPARAKQIMEQARAHAQYGPWSDQLSKVMTKGEYAYVDRVWRKMSGDRSFVDALNNIANGRVAKQVRKNPKSRSLKEEQILLHRAMERQERHRDQYEAKHAYRYREGSAARESYADESVRLQRKAHATRLRLAGLNQRAGHGMAETTAMVRAAGYPHRSYLDNPSYAPLNKAESATLAKIVKAGAAGVPAYSLNLRHLGRLERRGLIYHTGASMTPGFRVHASGAR